MNRLPLLAQPARALFARQTARSVVTRTRAARGGHGHGHGHGHSKPAGPYDPPHHGSHSEEAYLFNINPNQKYKWEGWEAITWLTYLGVFGVFVAIYTQKDNYGFQNWARREALAREAIIANGGTIEWGKWYHEEAQAEAAAAAAAALSPEAISSGNFDARSFDKHSTA